MLCAPVDISILQPPKTPKQNPKTETPSTPTLNLKNSSQTLNPKSPGLPSGRTCGQRRCGGDWDLSAESSRAPPLEGLGFGVRV